MDLSDARGRLYWIPLRHHFKVLSNPPLAPATASVADFTRASPALDRSSRQALYPGPCWIALASCPGASLRTWLRTSEGTHSTLTSPRPSVPGSQQHPRSHPRPRVNSSCWTNASPFIHWAGSSEMCFLSTPEVPMGSSTVPQQG